MASHKSAIKTHRHNEKSRKRGRQHRSRLRTQVNKMRQALDAGDLETARSLLPGTLSLIDHSAKLGIIHDNAAARTKSRIRRALNRLSTGTGA